MKNLVFGIAVTLILLFSSLSFGEIESVKVGGEIIAEGHWEKNYTTEDCTLTNRVRDYFFQETHLNVSLDFADNVSGFIQVKNERDWGTQRSDGLELEHAYLTLKEIYGYPVSLTIGRQHLTFGGGFLIDEDFDAFNLQWSSAPYTVDIFTAKLQEAYAKGTDKDLYGINWNINRCGVWDIGLFHKYQNPDDIDTDGDGVPDLFNVKGKNITTALSIRGEETLPKIAGGKLALKGEIVNQWGKVSEGTLDRTKEVNRKAWGGYADIQYTFDNPYSSYIGVGYIYRSGDKDPENKDSDIEEFDPFITDPDELMTAQFGEIGHIVYYEEGYNTNARVWKFSTGFSPTDKIGLGVNYYNIKADRVESGSKSVGKECDLELSYEWTKDLSSSLIYAYFDPGKYFEQDKIARELLWSVDIVF